MCIFLLTEVEEYCVRKFPKLPAVDHLAIIICFIFCRICASHKDVGKWTFRSSMFRWNQKVMSHKRKIEEKGK